MSKKKNILCIITDDHGAWAMGCAGNRELKTPTLDRIAASGVRFDNCFCASPVCSPARASIFTGKIPSQHGVHDWLKTGYLNSENLNDELKDGFSREDAPWYYAWPKSQLADDQRICYLDRHKTFTEILAENGYECGMSGKWHIGGVDLPQAGFTYWKPNAIGGENYMYPVMMNDNGKFEIKHNCYVTDVITDNAVRFLDERDKEKPFYLSVHYTAPHSPWSASSHPREFIEMYENCPFESTPNVPPHPWAPNQDKTVEEWNATPHAGIRFVNCKYGPLRETWQEHRRESLTGYYAAITAMDTALGRLIRKLEIEGTLEDTLIIFTADNGMSMGHHGIWGKGNGTFPVNMYDSAVKVPALFSMPGEIKPGQVCHEMVSHYDFYETILEMADIPFDKPEDMPGVSFAPLLRGTSERVRDAVVVFDEYGPCRMIRTQEWKLVLRYPDGPCELYHLTEDPGEDVNLYGDSRYEDIQAELAGNLGDWYEKYVDPEFDGSKENVTGSGQYTSHHFEGKNRYAADVK